MAVASRCFRAYARQGRVRLRIEARTSAGPATSVREGAMSQFTPTERTKVRRKPDRGSYDRELIYGILDEAFVCHVAFIADGTPFVVPTNYVRVGDKLFLHGSPASRLM